MKRVLVYAVVSVLAAVLCSAASANGGGPFQPGAPGIGDPYFPLEGNGGYDVGHYKLDINYDPPTNHIDGVATISATATENLSSFNLDLVGLNVHAITVDGWHAAWSRDAGELTVTPTSACAAGTRSRSSCATRACRRRSNRRSASRGSSTPTTAWSSPGEPDGAATWFPVNDHPLDKASYTFKVTVPAGLAGRRERLAAAHEDEPRQDDVRVAGEGSDELLPGDGDDRQVRDHGYQKNGIRFYDAIDPALFEPVAAPTTGTHLMISGQADSSYKRLMRTIAVPAGGATLSFEVTRDTEQNWDFMFVEAHTVGADDWTTLPDVNGHTSTDVGNSCPFESWELLHPFLAHYQTDNGDGTCLPATGTTGTWSAATGASDGPEQWKVDLSAYAGKQVEVSISYASDDVVQAHGVFVDDIVTSTGEGTTSFEDDGDTLDGWTVPGAPAGSPGNTNDFTVGTVADSRQLRRRRPRLVRPRARDPELPREQVRALSVPRRRWHRRSPAGRRLRAREPDAPDLRAGVLLRPGRRRQRRRPRARPPVVRRQRLRPPLAGHLAQRGLRDLRRVAVERARGPRHPAGDLRRELRGIPADDPFWSLVIGDPGPDDLFDGPVYVRGAMTLQALRNAVGDDAFFRILRKWASMKRGGNGSIAEFIKLAEHVSGQDLDALFTTWLYTPAKPAPVPSASAAARSSSSRRARSRNSRRTAATATRACAATRQPSSRWGASAASQRRSAMPSATASPLPRL